MFELIPRPRRTIAPGVVHVPGRLDEERQTALVAACREWARQGPDARRAALPGGARLSVSTVCLGWHWIPYRYSATRDDQDGSPALPFPAWLATLGAEAVADADDDAAAGTAYRPDVALVNVDEGDARLGMHQDREELAPDPVVSLSLGAACVFRIGGTTHRGRPWHDLELCHHHRRTTMTSTAPDVPGLADLDWAGIGERLDRSGFAVTEPLLTPGQCRDVIEVFDDDTAFRSTVHMARLSFGEGTYRYFADPLPSLVQELRTRLYPPLAAIANRWAGLLGEDGFPTEHADLVERCAAAGQHRPTPLVLRYGPTGYNCLHQDVYGDLTFPLQVLVMLNTPDVDFTGGESVFVEQRPRRQSRPMVARPGLGQAVVFPVRHRPQRGARGYHRVQMRHGVSAVHTGNRHVLGVIFHDAR